MIYTSQVPIIVPGDYTNNYAVLFKSGKKIQCHNLATARTIIKNYHMQKEQQREVIKFNDL